MSDEYYQYRQEFVRLLKSFPNMSDIQLGRISLAINRIDLTSRETSVFSAPYRAEPNLHKFQYVEIDGMLEHEDIEAATSECAAPVVIARNKSIALRIGVDLRK